MSREIYQNMLRLIETEKAQTLCQALQMSSNKPMKITKLKELVRYKPDKLLNKYYWFDIEDKESRIKILEKVLLVL